MLVDDNRPLELDESELFDAEEAVDMSPSSGPAAGVLQSSLAAAPPAAQQSDSDESESDDDGIVLESECSSSEAEDEVEQELVDRIQSLQSSLSNQPLQEHAYGTSHTSTVGSLKTFASLSFKGKRLFGSEGDIAASMPVHTAPMAAGRRKVAPVTDTTYNLGTSMPISIPMMQRRGSAAELLALEIAERVQASTFVPPHMLQQQSTAEFGGLIPAPSLGLSPSAKAKREKLLARNAILRSTGFIEVQHAPVIGEVMDPVKEVLGALTPGTGAVPVPAMRPNIHATPRSSLTQLLGTSK